MDKSGLTNSSNSPIPIIEAIEVRKTFNLDGSPVEVLRGIDLRLEAGESISIAGPSGAGKSTLLHILGMLEKPSGGQYLFEGRKCSELPEKEQAFIRLKRIGFIFQFHHLLPEFTALENVMLPSLLLGLSKVDSAHAAQAHLDDVGLSDRLRHRPGELSGGEQQRVALARALVNKPSLILADEPTGNLDFESAEMTASLLKKVARQNNAALILVTHNLRLAREMDRQVVMEGGFLRASSPA